MKKIMTVKNVLMAMVFSVAVLGGYQAYEHVSIASAESFLLANVEALADNESGNGNWWESNYRYCVCKNATDVYGNERKLCMGGNAGSLRPTCGKYDIGDNTPCGSNDAACSRTPR